MCERFGSAARLKADSHPIGGRDSVVTTGDEALEACLGTSGRRSPLWVWSTETMLIWVLKAGPAPVTAAAKPTTARQLTTPITAMFLAARRLTRAQKRQCYSYPSPTPLSGETRMVSTCRSIARWLMHAGR